MNLQTLSSEARAGHIEGLDLISMEGGIYLLQAHIDGRCHTLDDGRGHAMQLRSVEHARGLLHELPRLPFYLVHASVHDEMCGIAPDGRSALRVPLSMGSSR
ncbi:MULTISPECIES: DUF6482 family protein [Pseudomonas]|uniref:DUF6482 family protein n=1 Tax=Pseudomonas solani TaxID=2731552 RepID=A0AAU7Y6D6_9PSED|nr:MULTISPECIES: DUF6482 family protein [unclassified Pseudomonas]EQM69337.1 hypothetical protein L682_13665 [Pseudomonas alcaligenes OT 69]MBB4818582.1 hypothetical protein [Pseudomonas alcaligenes]MDN4146160.1 DUF6482 family protein [Pseudomonas tohonis]MDU9413358.1 DUF6482 family protein [Pseudomonas sp. zfem005]WCD81495.1 DUF6482 family protein [Pseudomonas sp. TUM22785]